MNLMTPDEFILDKGVAMNLMTPDEFILDHVVPALKSGRYEKVKQQLRHQKPGYPARYCLLGAIIDQAIELGIFAGTWESGVVVYESSYTTPKREGEGLPEPLARWLGISTTGHLRKPRYGWSRLDQLNDETSLSLVRLGGTLRDAWVKKELARD